MHTDVYAEFWFKYWQQEVYALESPSMQEGSSFDEKHSAMFLANHMIPHYFHLLSIQTEANVFSDS